MAEVDEIAANVLFLNDMSPIVATVASTKDDKSQQPAGRWLIVAVLIGFAAGLLILLIV